MRPGIWRRVRAPAARVRHLLAPRRVPPSQDRSPTPLRPRTNDVHAGDSPHTIRPAALGIDPGPFDSRHLPRLVTAALGAARAGAAPAAAAGGGDHHAQL